jgi:3-oxoadipate enol-lactonase
MKAVIVWSTGSKFLTKTLEDVVTNSKFLAVDGAQVAYRIYGKGPAIVLVNGTSGVDTHWGTILSKLAEQRTVVTLDYSGAGETTDDGGALSLPMLARQVAAVATASGFDRFDLVGHSLGAAAAVQLASERPEMVRSLVLVAGFLWGGETRLKLLFELWRELIRTNRAAFMKLLTLSALTPAFISRLDTPTLETIISDMIAATNWDGIERQVELDLKVDIRTLASTVQCATLVVACSQDQVVTQTRALADSIPGAVYREINAGHQGYFEGGEEFLAAIDEFLQERNA